MPVRHLHAVHGGYTLSVVEVMVGETHVRLELTSWDVLWALKSNLTFPIQGVLDVYADPTATRPKGFRLPGTSVPGLIQAGTYVGETREFWCVHHTGRSVVFELENLPFTRIVVDVRDPEAVVQRVQAARRGLEVEA